MTIAEQNAHRLAQEGYGWEDIVHRCPKLTRSKAWKIVKAAHRENSHDPT